MTDYEHVLDIEGLAIAKRGRRGSAVRLMQDVSLTVAKQEIVGVVGVSGSGKSLLAGAILGVLNPAVVSVTGSIRVRGAEIVNQSEAVLRARRGSDIGFVVSNARARLNPLMPVGKQLALAIREKREV